MLHKSGLKLFLAIFLLGFSAVGAKAVTYTVTNTFDSGAGSLRMAVATANGQTADDIINFNIPSSDPNCASGVCTITLTSGEIIARATSASGSIAITNAGGANKIIVSGNNNFRVFYFSMGTAAALLDSVTVTNGNSNNATNDRGIGGGIIVSSLTPSSLPLTITNSTVSNSSAQTGGGIFNDEAKVIITNSTVNNNNALNSGGGGGIKTYGIGASMTILNSTVSGNDARRLSGGIENDYSTLTIINSTVTNNIASLGSCGGIRSGEGLDTKTFIRNTIISANTALGQPDVCRGSSGTLTSNGNNLIGNTSDTENPIAWHQTDLLNRQPRLAALSNNGGVTQTHALQSDSEAINRGNNCVSTANGCGDGNPALTADQRGAARQSGTSVDIGAYELGVPTAAGVTINGRVFASERRGLANARVMLTTANGETQTVLTNSFGYYHFEDVSAGQTVVLNILSKRFQFDPQVVNVTEDAIELNFLPQITNKSAEFESISGKH